MLIDAATQLLVYLRQLFPGLALVLLWFALTPRQLTGLRIASLLLAFILARDLMTPLGFWSLAEGGLAFHRNPLLLASLGLAALVMIALLWRAAPQLWRLVVGFKGKPGHGLLMGLAAGCALGLPLRLLLGVELAPSAWLAGLLVLAVAGNALEELLFRGVLQGYLEQHTSALRAALGSAVAFAACHGPLALVLTQAGWPVLLFTLLEGLACALVRMRHGTVPAIITHALVIGLMAAPML
ncbi:lysostaphin resistance A-like protein [Pseudomonas xanthosomatis]|uniref:lysostaphin resistance A-like protein n=1 Tax=Pseudomonas xanthosomatis TaxID=2842356 RepID=UPI003517B92E